MFKKIAIIISALSYLPFAGGMQGAYMSAQRTPSTATPLVAATKGSVAVPFKTGGILSQYATPQEPILWGMDVAWDSEDNVIRGTNYITQQYLKVGRVSFQPSDLVSDDYQLSAAQQEALSKRLEHIYKSGVRNIVLNCDHEVLCNTDNYPNANKNYQNYNNKPAEWVKVIKASVMYCKQRGFNVVTISPFNEPDYTDWKEGTQANFKEIARLIREDSYFDGIRISAGNTLNCDKALSWYNAVKPYVSEGNTHQLAGSMTNYINFWKTVRADGNHATADELHNTMEAFIGVHYGMQTGIWWGWDGASRGEFCKAAATGKEIGYAENSSNWAGAAVYKWSSPIASTSEEQKERITAFMGVSERQAKPTTFDFVSTDRPAYFNGYGPVYSYQQYVPADPNGTYASSQQKNAERSFGITYGEDVPTDFINSGSYIIVNANSKRCFNYDTSAATPDLTQGSYVTKPYDYQRWTIAPVKEDIGGDFGYFFIRNTVKTDLLLDVKDWSTASGASIIVYSGGGGANEQWFLEYAGDNFWYIRSRHNGLYLDVRNGSTTNKQPLVTNAFTGAKSQKWRFIPENTTTLANTGKLEWNAPAAPTSLTATKQSGSVILSWTAPADTDLDGYEVLRTVVGDTDASAKASVTEQTDVIGRMVKGTTFIDNDITPGCTYIYKVKAIDRSRNLSEASEPTKEIAFATEGNGNSALIAHYSFDSDILDATTNQFDPIATGTVAYKAPSGVAKEGSNALFLDGSSTILTMPASLGNMSEMTIAAWVYNSSPSTSWMRIFDFGNDQEHYFFLTPNNGSEMRLVMKNGGDEQILSTTKLSFGWHYIAVTLAKDKVTLYVDNNSVSSTTTTIRPSDFMPKRNYIGASQFSADPLFRGYLDDLRIYNYPLSAAEISRLRDGKELPTGDANRDGKVTIDDANLVVNYALGTTTLDIDTDASDMDLDGTITEADAKAIANKYLTE